jgi:hypothetical protein
LVQAETDPYKIKPEDPGGLQVENTDKLVYERLGGTARVEDQPTVEQLLPGPARPVAPPAPLPPPAPVAVPDPGPAPAVPDAGTTAAAEPESVPPAVPETDATTIATRAHPAKRRWVRRACVDALTPWRATMPRLPIQTVNRIARVPITG